MVTYSELMVFLLSLYCLMGTGFSTLVSSIPILGDVGNWRLVFLLLSFVTVLLYIANTLQFKRYTLLCNRGFSLYVIALILSMAVLTVWSMKQYNQSVVDVLISSEGQYFALLVPAFLYVYFKTDDISRIFDALNKVLVFVLVLYIIANVLYITMGTNIFNVSLRFGHLRLDPPFFAGVLLVYNLWNYLIYRNRKALWIVIIYLVYLFTMSGTRMEMIASVVAIVVTMLVTRKGFGWQAFLILALGIVIAIANSMGLFDTILASFSETSSTYGVGTTVRMNALEYFSAYQEEHPLVGMGYIRGGVNTRWDTILYGPYGKYVFSDIGITGFFYKTGCLSFFIIGIPFVRMIYLFIKTLASKNEVLSKQMLPLMAGTISYLTVCQISLAITDIQRSMLLPLVWSLFEYVYYRGSNTEELSDFE